MKTETETEKPKIRYLYQNAQRLAYMQLHKAQTKAKTAQELIAVGNMLFFGIWSDDGRSQYIHLSAKQALKWYRAAASLGSEDGRYMVSNVLSLALEYLPKEDINPIDARAEARKWAHISKRKGFSWASDEWFAALEERSETAVKRVYHRNRY